MQNKLNFRKYKHTISNIRIYNRSGINTELVERYLQTEIVTDKDSSGSKNRLPTADTEQIQYPHQKYGNCQNVEYKRNRYPDFNNNNEN